MTSEEHSRLLDDIGRVLIRSLLLAWGVLLFWFLAQVMAGDLIHSIHSRWFDITRHEFDLISYGLMGLFKLSAALLFFFPWVGIRMVLRRRRAA